MYGYNYISLLQLAAHMLYIRTYDRVTSYTTCTIPVLCMIAIVNICRFGFPLIFVVYNTIVFETICEFIAS